MAKDARRETGAGRTDERPARGRNGAAGTWIVSVALGVCLAIFAGSAIRGGEFRLPVKPVHVLEESMLSGMDGDYRLDINRATVTEFSYLEGIGRTLAERIIAWREANGPFENIEQLMEVEGVGKGKFNAIRDMITVGE